jgi:sigma-B regulation protein RsbU (phosphoserine phosphatase)
MRRLLEDFETIFDLSHRVGNTTLGDLVERTIAGLDLPPRQDWGSEGSRDEVISESGRLIGFYYRPHLFPGMDLKLRLAHELQYRLLPQTLPPESPVTISAVLESYCHLSGDLFGWETLRDGKLLIWIADMAGHGLRAGLGSAVLRILVGSLRERGRVSLLLDELNHALSNCIRPDYDGLYATVFFMALDHDGRGVYSSAAHPATLLRRSGGEIEELRSLDRPMGLFADTTYRSRDIQLHPGDRILLYTDGLVEAEGFDNETFGIERLRGLLGRTAGGPRELTRAIYDEIAGRQDVDKLEDDVTFLAVEF